jgi:hypothetical protein
MSAEMCFMKIIYNLNNTAAEFFTGRNTGKN